MRKSGENLSIFTRIALSNEIVCNSFYICGCIDLIRRQKERLRGVDLKFQSMNTVEETHEKSVLSSEF